MSFTLSFTCGDLFAESASLAALAIVAGLLVAFGAHVLARCERDDERREVQPITNDWSADHDHDD